MFKKILLCLSLVISFSFFFTPGVDALTISEIKLLIQKLQNQLIQLQQLQSQNGQNLSTSIITNTVVLVIDKDFYDDIDVKAKIDRYKKDNPEYRFKEILFKKTNDSISSMSDTGGEIKKNLLEVRNTIKNLYNSANANGEQINGVWIIGNIRPTIWRDANQWRNLNVSDFYPSVYPLVSFGDYYESFDVIKDGFYEKNGVTTGSEVGGGNKADIWGATLIPPTTDVQIGKELIKNFFDRNHEYRIGATMFDSKIIYSDSFGCSTKTMNKIKDDIKWNEETFLCPNANSELQGFDSVYHILLHNRGPDFDPSLTGWPVLGPIGLEEGIEFTNWLQKEYFENSMFRSYNREYNFYLVLKGRSISTEEIRRVLENNLPSKTCARIGKCNFYVGEAGFTEDNGSWNGSWTSYYNQQNNWTNLYERALKNNKNQITYLNTHGAPTYHFFSINSYKVKNNGYNSLIYQIEACNTGNYLVNDYLVGEYLFYGNAQAVNGYSIPYVSQGMEGYYEGNEHLRFLNINNTDPIINALFLKNYGNDIYAGDPLLKIKNYSPNPSPSPTPSPSPSPTPSPSPSPSPTPSPSPSPTPSPTPTFCDSYGDVTLDGKVDIFDATHISKYLIGSVAFSDEQKLRADVNQDSAITNADAQMITAYVIGNISSIPACSKASPCLGTGCCSPDSWEESVRYGDVNNNGFINLRDAILISNYIVGKGSLSVEEKSRADVNADNKVSIFDSMFIAQYVTGNRSTFPSCGIFPTPTFTVEPVPIPTPTPTNTPNPLPSPTPTITYEPQPSLKSASNDNQASSPSFDSIPSGRISPINETKEQTIKILDSLRAKYLPQY